MKSKTESLSDFIKSLKRPDNEAFLENVVLKGLEVCFEAYSVTDEEKLDLLEIKDPENVDEIAKLAKENLVREEVDDKNLEDEAQRLKEEELKQLELEQNA